MCTISALYQMISTYRISEIDNYTSTRWFLVKK